MGEGHTEAKDPVLCAATRLGEALAAIGELDSVHERPRHTAAVCRPAATAHGAEQATPRPLGCASPNFGWAWPAVAAAATRGAATWQQWPRSTAGGVAPECTACPACDRQKAPASGWRSADSAPACTPPLTPAASLVARTTGRSWTGCHDTPGATAARLEFEDRKDEATDTDVVLAPGTAAAVAASQADMLDAARTIASFVQVGPAEPAPPP